MPESPPVDPSAVDPSEVAAAALRRATRSTAPARRTPRKPKPSRFSDDRDPQTLGAAIDRLIEDRGWQESSSVATLMAEWADIVGADLAAHVTPISFEGAELTLQAESTAWATAVRLLLPELHRTLDARLGKAVVARITITGPQAPTWTAGPRRVKGRGPRDTYG